MSKPGPPPDQTAPAGGNIPKKQPLKKIWTATDGGPGPAAWRKHDGKVHGQVRRKGEKNPMKFGLYFDDSIKDHPKMKDWKELPAGAVKTPKKAKDPNAASERKCLIM